MDGRKVNPYEACDRAIRALNRENVELFGRLKMAKWDQVHVIRTVTDVYRKSAGRAKKRYLGIAFDAYLLAMALCGEEPKKARKMAEKAITAAWVDRMLKRPDDVLLYRFDTETDRKAMRLAESIEATENVNREIDKALRYWSFQTGQYCINFTDYAMMQAYRDAGVEMVEWVTQRDERVCETCGDLDGERFRTEDAPPKQHPNCRCYLIPVR